MRRSEEQDASWRVSGHIRGWYEENLPSLNGTHLLLGDRADQQCVLDDLHGSHQKSTTVFLLSCLATLSDNKLRG